MIASMTSFVSYASRLDAGTMNTKSVGRLAGSIMGASGAGTAALEGRKERNASKLSLTGVGAVVLSARVQKPSLLTLFAAENTLGLPVITQPRPSR
jgi:hypothetical protein